eukprot:5417912-Amphidinium_carterae.1
MPEPMEAEIDNATTIAQQGGVLMSQSATSSESSTIPAGAMHNAEQRDGQGGQYALQLVDVADKKLYTSITGCTIFQNTQSTSPFTLVGTYNQATMHTMSCRCTCCFGAQQCLKSSVRQTVQHNATAMFTIDEPKAFKIESNPLYNGTLTARHQHQTID